MLSPQPLSVLVLAILLTLEVGATAQPTVPRDRAPVVPSAIRSFVDRLYSPDPKERAEAACQIGRRHAEAASAIPILLSMLSDDVPVPALEWWSGREHRRIARSRRIGRVGAALRARVRG